MELSSTTIKYTCKLCTFGSLLGCLIILLFLNQSDQNVSFLSITNITTLELPIHVKLEPPMNTSSPYTTLNNHTATFVKLDRPPLIVSNHTITAVENPGLHTEKLNFNLSRHIQKPINKTEKKCDIYKGRWVYKDEEIRKYDTNTCPFLEEKMSCQRNGRPDFEYEKWRWEATDCDIPSFNGTDMLERLRNKRMIIVGDSLNRNMWESLACLLYTSIPSSRAHVEATGDLYKVFKALDYNCVIEFYWSPFLVENHESGKKVLVLDQLSESSKKWKGADVMVFNSGHWWTHLGKFKWWDVFQYQGKLIKEMAIELAYSRGMKTWAKWVENNVDPKKTTVFYRSISPEHKAKQWCYNVTQPITDESYKSLYPDSLIDIIEKTIKEIDNNVHVNYMNITKLSSYRRDAHPSVYRSWKWKIYTKKYMGLIQSYADCSHWCLPGLPDTWNTFLYTSLFYHSSKDMSSS